MKLWHALQSPRPIALVEITSRGKIDLRQVELSVYLCVSLSISGCHYCNVVQHGELDAVLPTGQCTDTASLEDGSSHLSEEACQRGDIENDDAGRA